MIRRKCGEALSKIGLRCSTPAIKGWTTCRYHYGHGMPLAQKRRREQKEKRRRRGPGEKLDNAQARLKQWQTKRKLAETKIKAWRKRVRYYERAVVAKKVRDVAKRLLGETT